MSKNVNFDPIVNNSIGYDSNKRGTFPVMTLLNTKSHNGWIIFDEYPLIINKAQSVMHLT